MVQLMGGQANLGEHLLEGWIAAEGGEFRVNAKIHCVFVMRLEADGEVLERFRPACLKSLEIR